MFYIFEPIIMDGNAFQKYDNKIQPKPHKFRK